MWFFTTEQSLCIMWGKALVSICRCWSYDLTCVSAGQLGTSAGLWVKMLESGNGTAQQGVSLVLGMGKIALLNLTLISTIWYSLAQNVQVTRCAGICLQLQIDGFSEADNLPLFVLCSNFANKTGLSEYSENNWQYCSREDLMRVTSAFRKMSVTWFLWTFSEATFVSNGFFQ